MRVASKTIFDSVTLNLSRLNEALFKATETVYTGKTVTKPSDDPVGFVQAMSARTELANIEQMERNISLGNSWLNASEDAMSQAQDLISDARALCVQMASGTIGVSERTAAAQDVQNIMDEIISLANTTVNGRYIFSGSDTDSMPFDADGAYGGDDGGFSIKISKESTVEIGKNGDEVFGSIFSDLSDLKTALESNDTGGIGVSMDLLDDDFTHLSAQISDVGSKMTRLEIKQNILQGLNISTNERLSMIEDADLAEAITELSSIEYAYQAALSSSSKVMQMSILDYL